MTANLPLNALRAFEAAARAGSFVQAGAELGVTSAAVSQQVRALEDHLGKQLFLRQGNRISLTDAGRAVYPRIEAAFGDLSAVTAELKSARSRARLVLSVLPSVAELWLAPALRGFAAVADLDIRVEDDPVVFARDGVDLRLTYGIHAYPDHRVEVLFRDRLVAVAAPSREIGADGLAGLADEAFIHTDWGPTFATQPSWPHWFAAAGIARRPDPARGLRVDRTALAACAARSGLGVALLPERLATADLDARRLARVDPFALPMSSDYAMIWPNAISRRSLLQGLVAQLRGVAAG
ncbi:MAG: LysR substrate-binding domain-containing protein [Paracoccaceae bacterium]